MATDRTSRTPAPRPATALPWSLDDMIAKVDSAVTKTEYRKAESAIAGFVQGNAAYIAHACNEYPRLEDENRRLRAALADMVDRAPLAVVDCRDNVIRADMLAASDAARALLRSLGESE